MKLLLDTSAVSLTMRLADRAVARLQSVKPRDVLLSAPVAAEIRFGLERLESGSRRRRLLSDEYRRLRDIVAWVDWTEDAAEIFGKEKARLQSIGETLDDLDLIIASVALAEGAQLATANARHFERIESLEVDDWLA